MLLLAAACSLCRRLPLRLVCIVQVPPMPPAQTRRVLEAELNAPIEEVFEWIDLEKPLGSASISQVMTQENANADCHRLVTFLQ